MNPDNRSLAFLHDRASDKNRALSADEQAIIQETQQLLRQADEIVLCLGGKAGRLGECVVGTGFLTAVLQALIYLNKAGTPVKIRVDASMAALFDERLYQATYWPAISVEASAQAENLRCAIDATAGRRLLVLDFHGANDGMPFLQTEELPSSHPSESTRHISTLTQLFRVGLRSYAQRGASRRYADFIEELFALPEGIIAGEKAQPAILLSPADDDRYAELAAQLALPDEALLIVCFFQSVAPAKCYERWDEVLTLLSGHFAEHFPGQKLTFLLPCGPDSELPEGMRRVDMEEWLQDFTGCDANAQVIITTTPSLRDLAILTAHAVLALSNDTGPGHIAGALHIPTIVPFLPGNIYSRQVWASTPSHYGVTLEPNPFSYRELEAAVIWGRTHVINRIEPEALLEAVVKSTKSEQLNY